MHRTLKHFLEPDERRHEVRIGRYYADIAYDNSIIEIQTRNLRAIKDKLLYLLEGFHVTLVYPISHIKHIIWVDDEGEASKPRKSPKTGQIYDVFRELAGMADLLKHENFALKILLVDTIEYRCLNGWSEDKKRGSQRKDCVPVRLAARLDLHKADDYALLLPEGLATQFTSRDYQALTNIRLKHAQDAVRLLSGLGVIRMIGKRGRMKLYSLYPHEGSA